MIKRLKKQIKSDIIAFCFLFNFESFVIWTNLDGINLREREVEIFSLFLYNAYKYASWKFCAPRRERERERERGGGGEISLLIFIAD